MSSKRCPQTFLGDHSEYGNQRQDVISVHPTKDVNVDKSNQKSDNDALISMIETLATKQKYSENKMTEILDFIEELKTKRIEKMGSKRVYANRSKNNVNKT